MSSWLCLWQWLGGYLQFWGSCLIFFSDSSNFRQCSNVHARRHKCSRWCLQNNQCNWYFISNFSIGLYISSTSYLLEKICSCFSILGLNSLQTLFLFFFISTCIKKSIFWFKSPLGTSKFQKRYFQAINKNWKFASWYASWCRKSIQNFEKCLPSLWPELIMRFFIFLPWKKSRFLSSRAYWEWFCPVLR